SGCFSAQRESNRLIPLRWSLSLKVTSWDQVWMGPFFELEFLLLNAFNSLAKSPSRYSAGGTYCRSSIPEAICLSCSAFTLALPLCPFAVSHNLPAKLTKSGDRAKARPDLLSKLAGITEAG